MVRPINDFKLILEMYYTKVELSTADIKALFNCSRSTADKLKQAARKQMVEDDRMAWDARCVITESAYKAWGIDIEDIEKRALKISTLRRKLV